MGRIKIYSYIAIAGLQNLYGIIYYHHPSFKGLTDLYDIARYNRRYISSEHPLNR